MGEVKIKRERREETVQAYDLCKRDSYVVVAQLSPEFTGRLVDRWQELEAQQKPMNTLEMIAFQALALNETNKRVEQHEARLKELEADRSALDAMLDMNLRNKLEDSKDHPWGKDKAAAYIVGKITPKK